MGRTVVDAVDEPESPAAAQIVTPSRTPAWNASSMARSDCLVQSLSAAPQLIEITDGARSSSWTAASTALRKPCEVLGAK